MLCGANRFWIGLVSTLICSACIGMSRASIDPMDVGLSDDPTGAACEYFNIGAQMAWKNKGGDLD